MEIENLVSFIKNTQKLRKKNKADLAYKMAGMFTHLAVLTYYRVLPERGNVFL